MLLRSNAEGSNYCTLDILKLQSQLGCNGFDPTLFLEINMLPMVATVQDGGRCIRICDWVGLQMTSYNQSQIGQVKGQDPQG